MRSILYIFLALVFNANFLIAQSIDGDKSKVDFEISNLAFNTVEGSFSGLTGKVYLNEHARNKSIFKVCLDPATIETGIDKRDEHLRSEDFFWVSEYPEICFTGKSFAYLGEGRWQIKGNLEIRDVKKEITVILQKNDKQISCNFTIKRLDYNVGNDTSTFTAGDEVKLMVQIALQ